MPPKKQFSKEQIVDAAFEVAKTAGITGLTVRQVAKVLGSSVAPIYVNFQDVADLKRAVVQRVFAVAKQMMKEEYTGDRALDIGIASLRFAREYSVLFRELVLTKNEYMADYQEALGDDVVGELATDPHLEGFTEEEVMVLLLKLRIFQAGLSAMIANDLLPPGVDEQAQIYLLESAGADFMAAANLRKRGELR